VARDDDLGALDGQDDFTQAHDEPDYDHVLDYWNASHEPAPEEDEDLTQFLELLTWMMTYPIQGRGGED
jgi:hypothetical protein